MNAPEPITPTALPILAPVAAIFASPTNPRKRFPQDKHDELVASVREHGVLQPILLRPWPANGSLPSGKCIQDLLDTAEEHGAAYELVAGERRWRAARDACLDEVLAVVRELTDVQVLEIQVIENLQRSDVHPIEEAEGYGRLMKEADYNVDQLAAKVGKSRAYIYARLKLLDLCPEAREAFYADKLDASTALLVARIPGKELQKKAVKDITTYNAGEPMSFRTAKDYVKRNCMLRLADATFRPGDAKLLPEAGSCTICPKRTGNNPDLFGDVDDADVCTDPQCFEEKRLEHYLKLKDNAAKKGIPIIEGAEAKKLMPSGSYSLPSDRYVSLDNVCRDDEERRTYREILGKAAPVAAVIENTVSWDKKHPLIEVAEPKALAEALKKAGIIAAKNDAKASHDYAAEWEEREAKAKAENAWRAKLFQAVRENAGARFALGNPLAAEDLVLLAVNLFRRMTENDPDDTDDLMALWGKPVQEGSEWEENTEAFVAHLITLSAPDLCLFLTDLSLIDEANAPAWSIQDGAQPTRLLAQAARLGIDAEALREPAEPEQTPTPGPKSKSKKSAKTASIPPPAAQAQDKGANPAAPADGEGATPPAKKPKAKTKKEPALPANDSAAPTKTDAEEHADA